MTSTHLPSSSCAPFPGLAADSSVEAQEPGGWLHPEAQESRNLILRVNDAEPEPSLSRLRGKFALLWSRSHCLCFPSVCFKHTRSGEYTCADIY